jgi:aminoglycoside phosphotransferase (APT) family kinase protein
MHQWLDDDDALGLIDFDRFAAGEPEFDAATLVADLEYEHERIAAMEDLTAAVIDGYATSGVMLDDQRLRLHRAAKQLAKVARTANSDRPDRASQASRHLTGVEQTLDLG